MNQLINNKGKHHRKGTAKLKIVFTNFLVSSISFRLRILEALQRASVRHSTHIFIVLKRAAPLKTTV